LGGQNFKFEGKWAENDKYQLIYEMRGRVGWAMPTQFRRACPDGLKSASLNSNELLLQSNVSTESPGSGCKKKYI